MTRNVIDDGYTKAGHIKAAENHHDSMSFEFRPMLPSEVESVEQAIGKEESPEASVNIMAVALADHIVAWSETDQAGGKRPVNWEFISRLHYAVLNRLYRIVAGLDASDPIPRATKEQGNGYADSLRAKLKGKAPGAAEQEADAKNSEEG